MSNFRQYPSLHLAFNIAIKFIACCCPNAYYIKQSTLIKDGSSGVILIVLCDFFHRSANRNIEIKNLHDLCFLISLILLYNYPEIKLQ